MHKIEEKEKPWMFNPYKSLGDNRDIGIFLMVVNKKFQVRILRVH